MIRLSPQSNKRLLVRYLAVGFSCWLDVDFSRKILIITVIVSSQSCSFAPPKIQPFVNALPL